jgi:hypothetical protein
VALAEWALNTAGLNVELRSAAHFRLAIALMGEGAGELALLNAVDGRGLLDISVPSHAALHGALSLCAAVAVARAESPIGDLALAGYRQTIVDYLEDAERDAVRAGGTPDRWHLEFSAANVVAHRVAVFVELGDYNASLAAVDDADLSGLSDERRARVAADLDRAKAATAPREGAP